MRRFWPPLALFGILAVGLWTRVSHALASGLWRDEAQALDIAMLPSVRSMVEFLVQHESHPPLFYMLLRGWTMMAGSSDGVLAIPGIVLGMGSIVLAWWLGRELGTPASGLLAAGMVAVNYAVIEADATVRPYALLQLLLLASVALLWKAIADGRWLPLVPWGATAVALLYTHNWSVLPLAAMGVVTLWLIGTGRSALSLKHVLIAGMAVVLVWSPWIPELLHQARHGGHLSPSSSPLVRMAAQFTFVVPGYYDGHGIVAWAGAGLVLFLRRSAPALDRATGLGLTLLAGTVALTMLLAGLGSYATNLLIVHTVAMLAPLALVALACVLARPVTHGRLLARFAIVFVLIAGAADAFRMATTPRTNVDLIAELVSRESRPNDLVLVVPVYVASSVQRYYRGAATLAGYPDGLVQSPLPFNDRIARDTMSSVLAQVPALVRQTLARGGRIWQISFDPPEHLYRSWTRLEAELRRQAGSPVQIVAGRKEATLEHLDLRLWEVTSQTRPPDQ